MALHLYNAAVLHRQPGAVLKTTRGGVQSFTPTYIANQATIVAAHAALALGANYVKQIDATDPDFPGLQLEDKQLVFLEGGLAELTLQWEGITSDTIPPAFWRIVRTPSEEPIDSHPRFVASIGGDAANPKNGAKFDEETGIFEGFPMTATAGLRGVSKYLAENIVVIKEYVSLTAPEDNFEIPIRRAPSIDEADRGIETVPAIPAGYNWLQTDLVYSRRGGAYEIMEEYTASGKGGWNQLIYNLYAG